eukprot:1557249-Rhodomonas_salina.2
MRVRTDAAEHIEEASKICHPCQPVHVRYRLQLHPYPRDPLKPVQVVENYSCIRVVAACTLTSAHHGQAFAIHPAASSLHLSLASSPLATLFLQPSRPGRGSHRRRRGP